jgi:cobalt/nickel transport system permease protein
MATLETQWNDLKQLDQLATGQTMIHRLHPLAKLLVCLAFIVTVASFHKYDIVAMLPMLLYPVVLINLAELPAKYLLKRLLLIAPFIICIGILNPWFDRSTLYFGPFTVSGGWISFGSILLRIALTVLAALILIASSGLNGIGAALIKLKLPKVFVIQLLFIYRYLDLLIEETLRMLRAFSLRSLQSSGLPVRVWGSFVGQLLLRTVDRAQRIYQAMVCRGFTGTIHMMRPDRITVTDWIYSIGWIGYFILVRIFNIPELVGILLIGAKR